MMQILARLILAAALLAPSATQAQSERSAGELMDAVMWGKEPIGGSFALTDHTGKPRTDTEFRGKLMLVYFGFSFCPDVCPTDLMAIGQAIDKLDSDGDRVQPLFITVDPERDTPAHLADYVPYFHPRLIGLTGDAEHIRDAARAYRVYFAKVAIGGAAEYTVDHSGFIYLMDRDGKYLGFFPPAHQRTAWPPSSSLTLRLATERHHPSGLVRPPTQSAFPDPSPAQAFRDHGTR